MAHQAGFRLAPTPRSRDRHATGTVTTLSTVLAFSDAGQGRRASARRRRRGDPLGSVGSAACALWRELAPLLTKDRSFAIWPFDGDLHTLLWTPSLVVGESYPRAAYATALLPMPPERSSTLRHLENQTGRSTRGARRASGSRPDPLARDDAREARGGRSERRRLRRMSHRVSLGAVCWRGRQLSKPTSVPREPKAGCRATAAST